MKQIKIDFKRMLQYFFFGLLIFLTEWVNFSFFTDHFILPQWYVFISLSMIFGVYHFFTRSELKINISMFSLFLLIFILYIFIRSLFSDNLNITILSIPCFFILFLLFASSDEKEYCVYYKSICIMASLHALYGICQYFDMFPNHTSFPITGHFDNPAGFAACMVASLSFSLYLYNTSKIWTFISVISTVLILMSLILSESRTGVLCAIIITVIYAHTHFFSKTRTRKIVIVSVFVTILLLLAFGFKQNSSIGRLFIWQNTLRMVNESPIIGEGAHSFQAKYMPSQAEYFIQNHDNQYAMLADNVLHPFNEYILLIFEHGFVGFILLSLILIVLVFSRLKMSPVLLALIGISVFALFSYPLKYSYILVIMSLCCGIISKNIISSRIVKIPPISKVVLISLLLVPIYFLYNDVSFEYRWNELVKKTRFPNNGSLIQYKNLYNSWNGDPLFLYNYGAYLSLQGDYYESNKVLKECIRYLNNYEIQILIANNFYELKEWDNAEKGFKYALQMCPNRFVPLYQLFNIYIEKGEINKAREIGVIILDKPIKIETQPILQIKSEVSDFMNGS